jgi:hypothetical protein
MVAIITTIGILADYSVAATGSISVKIAKLFSQRSYGALENVILTINDFAQPTIEG